MCYELIVILGIGCCYFGGVMDFEGLWDLVSDGVDVVIDVLVDCWDKLFYYDLCLNMFGKMLLMCGGFICDIDLFDVSYFGIILCEVCWIDL